MNEKKRQAIVTTYCEAIYLFLVLCIAFVLILLAHNDFRYGDFSQGTGWETWIGFEEKVSPVTQKAIDWLGMVTSAVKLHDIHDLPLKGSSFTALRGRYLAEEPYDPWGNPFCVDASIGLIISFGADGLAGGCGDNADVYEFYKPALSIKRAQYDGSWGAPVDGDEVIVQLTKSFQISSESELMKRLHLLTDLRCQPEAGKLKGCPVSFLEMNQLGEIPPDWKIGGEDDGSRHSHSWKRSQYHSPASGVIGIRNGENSKGEDVQVITPSMALNFDISIKPTVFGGEYGIVEISVPGGPLTTAIYGERVVDYYRPPAPVPLYQGENRGCKLEKF